MGYGLTRTTAVSRSTTASNRLVSNTLTGAFGRPFLFVGAYRCYLREPTLSWLCQAPD